MLVITCECGDRLTGWREFVAVSELLAEGVMCWVVVAGLSGTVSDQENLNLDPSLLFLFIHTLHCILISR